MHLCFMFHCYRSDVRVCDQIGTSSGNSNIPSEKAHMTDSRIQGCYMGEIEPIRHIVGGSLTVQRGYQ